MLLDRDDWYDISHDVDWSLSYVAHDDAFPPVPGDRIQLQQMFLNPIMNTIQAMSGVHDRPRESIIRSEARTSQDDGVLITVADSGTSLDSSAGERIFDSMFTTKDGGTGMGLSISRAIIAAHGGRIWASSGQSFGANFHIVLPPERGSEDEQIR
jgi:signal transduction histidine kinase